MLKHFKALCLGPRTLFKHWINHYCVTYQNPGAFVEFPVVWRYDNVGAIKLHEKVTVGAFSEIVVFSESSYSGIPGKLVVSERSIIGAHANIRAAGGEILIGKNSLIAQHVSLIASGHLISLEQPYRDLRWDESKVGIYIGENVWIGANVSVLPGCCIGNNSIVGSGSVVTSSIPENEIWVGAPARKLRNVKAIEETTAQKQ